MVEKMFNLREIWIPAYFIDSPLYGLMRTTSRSESENSFFKSFTSPGATLVSFMMSYESAMERQSKDEGKMGTYVENLKKLFDEVKADMPNPPSRDTGDVIGGIFSITKSDQVGVQKPTKAVNKGEHLKKGERLKSEREKAFIVAKKKVRPCGFCEEMTNEHTKTTCPLNLKARKKKKGDTSHR
ncbi:FAR1-related sequence 5-like protein [Tanacetum coccineum]